MNQNYKQQYPKEIPSMQKFDIENKGQGEQSTISIKWPQLRGCIKILLIAFVILAGYGTLTALSIINNRLHKKIDKLGYENYRLEKTENKLRNQTKIMSVEVETLRNQSQILGSEVQHLNNTNLHLHDQIEDFKDTIIFLNDTIDELTGQIEELGAFQSSLEETLELFNQTNMELKLSLSQSETEKMMLQSQLENSTPQDNSGTNRYCCTVVLVLFVGFSLFFMF